MNLRQVFVSGASVVLTASVLTPLLQPVSVADESYGRLAKAFQMYAEDADDILPLAYAQRADGSLAWNRTLLAPNGWTRDPGLGRVESEAMTWINTIQPYLQDKEDLTIPGAETVKETSFTLDYENPSLPPLKVGFTYNGLLNSYPRSAIVEPAKLPVAWTGHGKANVLGAAISNPALNCIIPRMDCRYQANSNMPAMSSRAVFFALKRTIHIDGNKTIFLTASGGVWKMPIANVDPGERTNPEEDPFAEYDREMKPTMMWMPEGYPNFFRPDYGFRRIDP